MPGGLDTLPGITVSGVPTTYGYGVGQDQIAALLQRQQQEYQSYIASMAQQPTGGGVLDAALPLVALPELLVEAPRLTPEPVVRPIAGVGSAANEATVARSILGIGADIVSGIGLALVPLPTAPGAGNLNEPLPGSKERPIELPQVEVVAFPVDNPIEGLKPFNDVQPILRPFADQYLIPDFGFGRPDAVPGIEGVPRPGTVTAPSSRPRAPADLAPDLRLDPFADPFAQPGARPAPSPAPGLDARPGVRPGTPSLPTAPGLGIPLGDIFNNPINVPTLAPNPFVDPLTGIDSLLSPSPESEPKPDAAEDPCNCGSKKKKEKKKKRKPRSVCWKGTYVQRATGISYKRVKQVICGTNIEVGDAANDPFFNLN